jgi:FXSXX-COOH protein
VPNRRTSGPDAGEWDGALPDLTGLDLETLRRLDHPVLSAVVAGLIERTAQSVEVLPAFNNSL